MLVALQTIHSEMLVALQTIHSAAATGIFEADRVHHSLTLGCISSV